MNAKIRLMNAKIRLLLRVAARRVEAGEKIEDILDSWTALTEEEKKEIREAIE
jgi:hypothetical protein